MNDNLNILILSCGTRNKIIQYFKKELKGEGLVLAADSSKLAPALYVADKHFVIPKINQPNYIDTILTICEKFKVKAVLSLIDPELSVLAKHREEFLKIGTLPLVSDYDVVELCCNKYEMYRFLIKNNMPAAKSYIDKQEFFQDIESGIIKYPVFVKPINGSASLNIKKVYSNEEIELLFKRHDNLLIQEYMDGTEYGVDVYIDMISEEIVSVFIKEKIKMRAGETDKSVSVKNNHLLDLVIEFVKKVGFKGIIDIDIFNVNGKYYISEVNPRFGGGYPHAYECGVNVPHMIINNLKNNVNLPQIGKYPEGKYMIKYSDLIIIP